MLCCVAFCCAALCYVVLCCVALCCVVLCCGVVWSVLLCFVGKELADYNAGQVCGESPGVYLAPAAPPLSAA